MRNLTRFMACLRKSELDPSPFIMGASPPDSKPREESPDRARFLTAPPRDAIIAATLGARRKVMRMMKMIAAFAALAAVAGGIGLAAACGAPAAISSPPPTVGALLPGNTTRVGLLITTPPSTASPAPNTMAVGPTSPSEAGNIWAGVDTSHTTIGDFLDDPSAIEARLGVFVRDGARLHALRIFDPAEAVPPWTGNVVFRDPETGERFEGRRAEALLARWSDRWAAHGAALAHLAARHGWSLATHATDRPAAEALLALHASLGGGRHGFARHGEARR